MLKAFLELRRQPLGFGLPVFRIRWDEIEGLSFTRETAPACADLLIDPPIIAGLITVTYLIGVHFA